MSATDSEDEPYQDISDDSIASSFPSTINYPLLRQSSSDLIAGRWNQAAGEEAAVGRDDPDPGTGQPDIESEVPYEPEWPLPKTTGAFEVDRHKRTGMSTL